MLSICRPSTITVLGDRVYFYCKSQSGYLAYFEPESKHLVVEDELSDFSIDIDRYSLVEGDLVSFFWVLDRLHNNITMWSPQPRDAQRRRLMIRWKARDNERIESISYDKSCRLLTVLVSAYRCSKIYLLILDTASQCLTNIKTVHTEEAIRAVCSDKNGSHLFILMKSGYEVRKIDTQGRILCTAGRYGREGKGAFRNALYVKRIDEVLAIGDVDNYLIQYLDVNTLEFIGQFGGKGQDLSSLDMAIDICSFRQGFLVADSNNDRILWIKNISETKAVRICRRIFHPSILSRPVALALMAGKVYVSDRSNNAIQVFTEDLKYMGAIVGKMTEHGMLRRPCGVHCFTERGTIYIIVLYRNLDGHHPILAKIDPESDEIIVSKQMADMNDPQSLVSIDEETFVISDTLNRRAIQMNNRLEVIRQWDLADIADKPRFLCRSASRLIDRLLFIDFDGGTTVSSGLDDGEVQVMSMVWEVFGFYHVRKVIQIEGKFLIVGRGIYSAVYCMSLNDPESVIWRLSDSLTVVDGVDLGGDSILLLLKERDCMVRISKDSGQIIKLDNRC